MNNPFSGIDPSAMNSMSDPLGFVKKLWGNMAIPGMVAPPMSVDELDKKIQDLKTVESWLTVNMNMLRGTIQALEVQRATLSTLQSLGESFAQHVQKASAPAASTPGPSAAATATWPMSTPVVSPEPHPDEQADTEHYPAAAPTAPVAPVAVVEAHAPAATTPALATPTAWWGLLQDQFKQALTQALVSDASSETGSVTTHSKPDHAAAPLAPLPKPRRASAAKPSSKTAPPSAAKVSPKAKPKVTPKAAPKAASKRT